MKKLSEKNVGQIVAEDYRTAAIFKSHGIDFCCNGNRTLAEVCVSKNISEEKLEAEIQKTMQLLSNQGADFQSWPADLLVEYIEKKHHRYVSEKIPVIRQYLEKICAVHGKQHPELFKIKDLFFDSSGQLTAHMKKEELILFPFIKKMVKAKLNHTPIDAPNFQTVQNPVQMMMHEHDAEGEKFRKISALSQNYTPPEDACNTYMVTFSLLKEFEADLHLHIHLENNILFPQAIEMEKQLAA